MNGVRWHIHSEPEPEKEKENIWSLGRRIWCLLLFYRFQLLGHTFLWWTLDTKSWFGQKHWLWPLSSIDFSLNTCIAYQMKFILIRFWTCQWLRAIRPNSTYRVRWANFNQKITDYGRSDVRKIKRKQRRIILLRVSQWWWWWGGAFPKAIYSNCVQRVSVESMNGNNNERKRPLSIFDDEERVHIMCPSARMLWLLISPDFVPKFWSQEGTWLIGASPNAYSS